MLEFYVYREDFNKCKIEEYNIFKYSYLEELFKDIKQETKSKEEFSERIDKELRWRFWSKCEHEIILSEWPPSEREEHQIRRKIDVYQQIKLNWNLFIDYVYNNI